MNAEKLAFFNLQLAGMVRSGIPLEGALRQLSSNLDKGTLRAETDLLAGQLAQGTPLAEALQARTLPAFYKQMLLLGARSRNLPDILVLVSDYYRRMHALWTRLKGMLLYPLIVLVGTFLLSLGFSVLLTLVLVQTEITDWGDTDRFLYLSMAGIWSPPVSLLLLLLVLGVVLLLPGCRQALQWRVPGVREGNLGQLAASLALLLESGCSLQEAVAFLSQLTSDRKLRRELEAWQASLASGVSRFADMVPRGSLVPPLWVWVVANSGDDLARGFRRAADLYESRARYRYELCLYAVLPVSVLVLGGVVLGQVYFMITMAMRLMDHIGDLGSF